MLLNIKFNQYSYSLKFEYINQILLNIQNSENIEVILFQKLLAILKQPSEKLLDYMFKVIKEQLKQLKSQELSEQELKHQNVRDLIKHIDSQEKKEEQDIDVILKNL